jgi:hypothetical protein
MVESSSRPHPWPGSSTDTGWPRGICPMGSTTSRRVLTHPVVNVVFEGAGATVTGPREEAVTKVLTGRGRALA